MAAQIESLLKTAISLNADYETTRLIKAGELGTAATNVLKARRKSTFRQESFLIAILLFLALSHFLNLNLISGQSEIPNAGRGLELGLIYMVALF